MDHGELRTRLDALRREHRDLDGVINAESSAGVADQIGHARYKKRKLRLRDEIATIEALLIPDILA